MNILDGQRVVMPCTACEGTGVIHRDRIPLYNRQREIVAHALIDPEDFDLLTTWRWSFNKGYAKTSQRAEGKTITLWMHRVVMGCEPGDGVHVDHRDRENTLDNRKENLRRASPAENSQNLASRTHRGYRGVRWDRDMRKWKVTCTLRGRQHHLGYFADETEAATVAAAWRRENMPFASEAQT